MSKSSGLTTPKRTGGKAVEVPDDVRTLALFAPEDVQDAAALLSMGEDEAVGFMAQNYAAIDMERRRLEITSDMSLLHGEAQKLALKLLRHMGRDIDSLDTTEAADLLKGPMRILENADRVRLAEREDNNVGLPVFNFTFFPAAPRGASTHAEVIKPAADGVLDVEARDVPGADRE